MILTVVSLYQHNPHEGLAKKLPLLKFPFVTSLTFMFRETLLSQKFEKVKVATLKPMVASIPLNKERNMVV